VTVADDALVTVRGLQIGMLAEKVCNLGLYRLGEQGTRTMAQDFGELIVALVLSRSMVPASSPGMRQLKLRVVLI
jgi:hypothetical protein